MLLPYARVRLGRDSSGRPVVVNRRTDRMLREAEKLAKTPLTIVQGSYREGSGAAASAATHDGGGVVDLRTWNLKVPVVDVVHALRRVGFAAWFRSPLQGFDPHIHAVAIGDRDLHPTARAQVEQYRRGLNGLANHGRDDGPQVRVRTWEEYRRKRNTPPTLRAGGKAYPWWTRRLQRGLGVDADGHFGPQTAAAVKAFRRGHKLWPYTAVAGRRVWRKLGYPLSYPKS